MKTITETVTLYLTVYSWDKDKYHWLEYANTGDDALVLANKDFELSIEIPDDDEITGMQIVKLEKEKEKINTKAFMDMKLIDEKIKSLKAIGHDNV